ncbi:hypothetical protein HDU97_006425 [Phlyctochytrium planicorne]|nr:hypothetical protein HDU97_006425 [Phlyctochytrium planicorne]
MGSIHLFFLLLATCLGLATTAWAVDTAVVQVASYNINPSSLILQGDLRINNLGYSKQITVYYSTSTTSWSPSNNVTAYYTSSIPNTSYETWSFKGALSGPPLAFYVKANINGNSYYANNNNANYPLSPAGSSPPVSSPISVGGKFFDRVMIIYLENTDVQESLADPYLGGTLKQQGLFLGGYQGVTHPSQGNCMNSLDSSLPYIKIETDVAAIAGELCGIQNDNNYDLNQWNIVDVLDPATISWKAYMEGYPGSCFTGVSDGLYWRKHNPFISFNSIRNKRCDRIVNSLQLSIDEATNQLPQYIWFTPDQDNDGHDTTTPYTSSWLSRFLTPRLSHPSYARTLFVITYDEADNQAANQNLVYTLLVGAGIDASLKGTTYRSSRNQLNHYSILKSVLENWSLAGPGKGEVGADRFPLTSGVDIPPTSTVTTVATTITTSTTTAMASSTSTVITAPPTTTTVTTVLPPPPVTTTTIVDPPLPPLTGPISVVKYSYTSGVLAGQLYIQNLAYTKVVTVFWQDANGIWATTSAIQASYSSSVPGSGGAFEYWNFSGSIPAKPKAFYVKYTVSGTNYYANNGGGNYIVV